MGNVSHSDKKHKTNYGSYGDCIQHVLWKNCSSLSANVLDVARYQGEIIIDLLIVLWCFPHEQRGEGEEISICITQKRNSILGGGEGSMNSRDIAREQNILLKMKHLSSV